MRSICQMGTLFKKSTFFTVFMVFTDVFNCFKPLLWTKSQKNSEQNIKNSWNIRKSPRITPNSIIDKKVLFSRICIFGGILAVFRCLAMCLYSIKLGKP